MRLILPGPVVRALMLLESAHHQAVIVGGCVRDALMGLTPKDYDIATSARPEETQRVFAGYPVIETGLQHGTVTAVVEGMPLEITTFRVDGDYLDGRHPEQVRFTPSLREDVKRRDFTVNALAYSPEAGLIDYVGGQRDLQARLLRAVGCPAERFREDALRVLRALRFSSEKGFEIEAATGCALRAARGGLERVARERIAAELRRMMLGADAERVTLAYREVLESAVAGLALLEEGSYRRGARLAAACPPDWPLRLAALCGELPAPAFEALLSGLRLSREERGRSLTFYQLKALPAPASLPEARRLVGAVGPAQARLAAALWERGPAAGFTALLDQIEGEGLCCRLDQLAVSGRDLQALGCPPGKRLGGLLAALLSAVLAGELPNERPALLHRAQQLL